MKIEGGRINIRRGSADNKRYSNYVGFCELLLSMNLMLLLLIFAIMQNQVLGLGYLKAITFKLLLVDLLKRINYFDL